MDNNHPFWNTVGDFANVIGLNQMPGSRIQGAAGLFRRATRNLPQGGGSYGTTTTNTTPQSTSALTRNNVPDGGIDHSAFAGHGGNPLSGGNNYSEPSESDIAYVVNKIGSAYQGQSAASLYDRRRQLMDEKSRSFAYQEENPYYNKDEEVPYTYQQLESMNDRKVQGLSKEIGYIDDVLKKQNEAAGTGSAAASGSPADIKSYISSFTRQKGVSATLKAQLAKGINMLTKLEEVAKENPGGNFEGGSSFGGQLNKWFVPDVFRSAATSNLAGDESKLRQDLTSYITGAAYTSLQEKDVNRIIPRINRGDPRNTEKVNQMYNTVLGDIESALIASGFDASIPRTESLFGGGGSSSGGGYTGGGGGGQTLVSPDGVSEVDVSELTPEEYQEAIDLGWQ